MQQLVVPVEAQLSSDGDQVVVHLGLPVGAAGARIVIPRASIDEATKQAGTDYYCSLGTDPQEQRRRLAEAGCRLYGMLDRDGDLSRFIDDTRGQWQSLVLSLAVGRRLSYLPWEVLHDGAGFLAERLNPVVVVRRVPGSGASVEPRRSELRLLFMACAPRGIPDTLDYDAEVEWISQLARPAGIDQVIDDTGDLTQLRERLLAYPEGHFDIVHLSGHARLTAHGARLLTEGPHGQLVQAGARQIHAALGRLPRMLFLSGCRTAEAADDGRDLGAMPSLAEQLARESAPVVLGWGRPVADDAATKAVSQFYAELARGLAPGLALALTHRHMLEQGIPAWHLMRMYVRGALPGPLVSAARDRPRDRKVFGLRTAVATVGDRDSSPGFVGRHREVQHALQALDPATAAPGRVGLLIHGPGGIGKTALTNHIEGRLWDDYEFIKIKGAVNEDVLLDACGLNHDLSVLLHDCDPSWTLPLRLADCLRRLPNRLVFVLDEFEPNFSSDPADPTIVLHDGKPVTQPVATQTTQALVAAVRQAREAGRVHWIIITTRHVPGEPWRYALDDLPLGGLQSSDVDRLITRLQREGPVSPEAEKRVRQAAGANPRLVIHQFDVARRAAGLDDQQLDRLLYTARREFIQHDLRASQLAAQVTADQRALLLAARPFAVPVSVEVLARMTGWPVRRAEEVAGRLADLELLEESDGDSGGTRYRFDGVFAEAFPPDDNDRTARLRSAATELHVGLGGYLKAPDPRNVDRALLRESRRLAALSGLQSVFVAATVGLANIDYLEDRDEQAMVLCREALRLDRDHRLLRLLAACAWELGRPREADLYAAEALDRCPPDSCDDRAEILATIAFHQHGAGDLTALRPADEAIDIARRCPADSALTWALRTKARILADLRQPGSDRTIRELIAESLDVASRIDDRSARLAAALFDRAVVGLILSDPAKSVDDDLAECIRLFAAAGHRHNETLSCIQMADLLITRNELDAAERMLDQARDARRGLQSLHIRASIQYTAGTLHLARGELDSAVAELDEALRLAEKRSNFALRISSLRNLRRIEVLHGHRREAEQFDHRILQAMADDVDPHQRIDVLISTVQDDAEFPPVDLGSAAHRLLEAAELARSIADPGREINALQQLLALEELETSLREAGQIRLIDLLRESARPAELSFALYSRAQSLIGEQRPAEAEPLLLESLDLDRATGDVRGQAVLHDALAAVARRLERLDGCEIHLCRSVVLWWGLADGTSAQGGERLSAVAALWELATCRRQRSDPSTWWTLLATRSMARSVPSAAFEHQALQALQELANDRGDSRQARVFAMASAQAWARTDAVQVRVAENLISYFDPDAGSTILAEISRIRAEVEAERSWQCPVVRIVDDEKLADDAYTVNVWGSVVHTGRVLGAKVFSRATPNAPANRVTLEPGFVEPVEWVPKRGGGAGQASRHAPIDVGTVAAANIVELAWRHRQELDSGEPVPAPDPNIQDIPLAEILGTLTDATGGHGGA